MGGIVLACGCKNDDTSKETTFVIKFLIKLRNNLMLKRA